MGPFAIASTSQITMGFAHSLTSHYADAVLIAGCQNPGPLADADPLIRVDEYCVPQTLLLAPGTYELAYCPEPAFGSIPPTVVVEPPPSISNASCATAAPLNQSWTEQRVVDATVPHYVFSSSPVNTHFRVKSTERMGSIVMTVRSGCDGPVVATRNFNLCTNLFDGELWTLGTLPEGSYYVTVEATPGTKYSIRMRFGANPS